MAARLQILFYYLPVVLFLALGLDMVAGVVGLKGAQRRNAVIVGESEAALALFLLVVPLLVGAGMPDSYRRAVHSWFRWVF